MTLQHTRDFSVDTQRIARELSTSERKFKVFRAVYSGGSKPKDAFTIAAATEMDRMSVLQVASPMAHKGYFEALKQDHVLCFRKYKEINAVRHEIFRLARNKARLQEPSRTTTAIDDQPVESHPSPKFRRAKPHPERHKDHPTIKKYEVAISFAGEDRKYAAALAKRLRAANVPVFYDEYAKAELWGNDLYEHLKQVYGRMSRYCVVFISRHYKRKAWTRHELKSAQEKALRRRKAYILPVKVDGTSIPSIFTTTGYLDLKKEKVSGIFKALMLKLGKARQTHRKTAKGKVTGDQNSTPRRPGK